MEVWLLSLTYAPVKGQWLNTRPGRSVRFRRQTVSCRWQYSLMYFLSLHCYINPQIQHYRHNILIVYSTLFYTSAVHITQLSVLTNSGVKLLRNSDNYYCEKECIRKLPGTIKCIGSNTKLECKINGITQGKMKQWLVVKELAVQILQCNIGHRK